MAKISFKFDFRLVGASLELYGLEEHLKLIENQIANIQETAHLKARTYIREKCVTPDEPEWHIAWQEYDKRVDSLPRIYRGPFLVALYAVYESIVTEIADLIQQKQGGKIGLNDLRGSFLERAKKYYKYLLRFELYKEEKVWQDVKILTEIRNAFAHANGRMGMLNKKSRDTIEKWERGKIGISTWSGYIMCDEEFVARLFAVVRGSLDDLIKRYKQWDDHYAQT